MCPPVMAAATFALGALQAVMSFSAAQQQKQVGDAMAARQTERYHANVRAAQGANRQEHAQLHRRELQERDAVIEKDRIGAVDVAKARARQAAVSGEAGVTGISVDAILADIERGEASNRVMRETNYMNTVAQIRGEMVAADAKADARINSQQLGYNPDQGPSGLSLVAGLAGAGLSAAGAYERSTAYGKRKEG